MIAGYVDVQIYIEKKLSRSKWLCYVFCQVRCLVDAGADKHRADAEGSCCPWVWEVFSR